MLTMRKIYVDSLNTNTTDISVNTYRHTMRDHSLGIFVHVSEF